MPGLRAAACGAIIMAVLGGCVSPAEKERIIRAEIARAQAAKDAGEARRRAAADAVAAAAPPAPAPPPVARPAPPVQPPPRPVAPPQPVITRPGQIMLTATSYVVWDECRVMVTAENNASGRLRDLQVVAEVVANRTSYPAVFQFPLLSRGLRQQSFHYVPLPACTVPLRLEVIRARRCWIDQDDIDECTGLLGAARDPGDPALGVRPMDISLPTEFALPRRQPPPAE